MTWKEATVECFRSPFNILSNAASRAVNEVRVISKSKPPSSNQKIGNSVDHLARRTVGAPRLKEGDKLHVIEQPERGMKLG